MRTLAVLVLLAFSWPAGAQSIQVSGTLGYLSEWEVTAQVTESDAVGKKEFFGPLKVKHIGLCTPGREVEMSGKIRFWITGWLTRRMTATLTIDGDECRFDGKLSEAYEGVITCQQWRGIPLRLSVGN
jgi:hypothetical protein